MIAKVSDLTREFPSRRFDLPNNLIPPTKRWHLIIDKSVQHYNNPQYFDQTNVRGEPGICEPGFYMAMAQALDFVLANISAPLNCDFLLELHRRATEGVKSVSPGQPPREFFQGFVSSSYYGFMAEVNGKKMAPTDAAKEEWETEKLIYDLSKYDYTQASPWDQGYLACYKPAGSHGVSIPQLPMPVLNDRAFMLWLQSKHSTTHVTIPSMGASSPSQNPDTSATVPIDFFVGLQIESFKVQYMNSLYSLKDHTIISRLGVPTIDEPGFHDYNKIYIEPVLNKIIQKYYIQLGAAGTNDEAKLLAIVRCIRALEIAHPFADANQRVFVFLLLNKLLLQNGFLPVIIENPYVFDGYLSAAELVDELKIGFINFMQFVHNCIPESYIVDDDLLAKIRAAVTNYVTKTKTSGLGSLLYHGNDGIRRAEEFQRQTIEAKKTGGDLFVLLTKLARGEITRDAAGKPIGGQVRANSNSFISYLLNQLQYIRNIRQCLHPQNPGLLPRDLTQNNQQTNLIRAQILANLQCYLPSMTDTHTAPAAPSSSKLEEGMEP